jgi:ADP-ribose pyrophosphatase YjhB (NUDIX family)
MKLPTAGLLIIQDKKLLLAYSKNKRCFYLPGGKVDIHETATQALCREILEELNVAIEETELTYYTHITAPAYGEEKGTIMEQECFLLQRPVSPAASAEVSELKYFSLEEYLSESNQAPGAVMILTHLQANGLIN